MGILNVTPDSFSDGGMHNTPRQAIAHARTMIAEGADIIDIGGESTRPGAVGISAEEEQQRILPVIAGVAELGATISVDTMNAATARAAIAAGAHIINDVSGLNVKDEMLATVAELGVPYILMHSRGTSTTMNEHANYPRGTVTEVVEELKRLRERCLGAGIAPENIILDPGLGFAKVGEQDWELLGALDEFKALGHRLLIAASRKRSIANALQEADTAQQARLGGAGRGQPPVRVAAERDAATAALSALMAYVGVWAVRVHRVQASADAITVAMKLREFSPVR